jgi:hypothetical protein
MRRTALWVAAAVIVVSNAVGLGYAWWNRSGAVEADLALTEREAFVDARETENTAIMLRLSWIDPSRASGTASWFDTAKLREVGFDCSVPPTGENAKFYMGQASRAVYAALEYEGDGWQRYLETIPEGPERVSALAASHLVVIDAGLDAADLRRRHPDRRRVVIAPATAAIEMRRPLNGSPVLAGHVTVVYPFELSVPKPVRGVFERLPASRQGPFEPRSSWRGTPLAGPPRYTVTLQWGRSLEPWLAGAERAPAQPR